MTVVLRPGTRVGRYELRSLLGRGGMGEVWAAALRGPRGFEVEVALKLLPARSRTSPQDEARIGGLLAHPNVASTYELGWWEGGWFIAMELVDGVPARRLAGAGLVGRALVELGVQACAALAHVHALAFVHRDVKPDNLLVARSSGVVKLVDLGIARLAGAGALRAGTAGYMAPEQLDGREDARADLFALGVTLYELATGAMPFGSHRGATARAEVAWRRGDPKLARRAEDAVPGLGAVLLRCFEPAPHRRWASAAALGDALLALASGLPRGPTLLELARRSESAAAEPTEAGSAPAPPLPPPIDRFVGREAELAAVRDALDRGVRGFAVVGGPGMGKTAFALEVARRLAVERGSASVLVALDDVRGTDAVCAATAERLGLRVLHSDGLDHVGRALAGRDLAAVVLDGVGPDAAQALERWAVGSSGPVVLATSRVRLAVPGYRSVRLGPLSEAEALALFEARGGRDREGLAALDGLPLAIELAAAGALPARGRRTLDAALDAAWAALAPWQRTALAELAAFAAGVSLAAADEVLALPRDAPWTLDVLASLADHHLLSFDPQRSRFSLLAPIRAYAARRDPSSHAEAVRRHAAWFARFGTREALRALDRHGGATLLATLADDRAELEAAALRAREQGDRPTEVACALAAAAVRRVRGPASAGVALLAPLLDGDVRRAELLELSGVLLREAGRTEAARERLEEALAAYGAVGDRGGEATAAVALAGVLRELGLGREALRYLRVAGASHRARGDRAGEGAVAAEVASVRYEEGRSAAARRHFREALDAFREVGHRRAEGKVWMNLALVAHRIGRLDEARSSFERALAIVGDLGDRWTEGVVRANLGLLHKDLGDRRSARAELEASLVIRRELGDRRSEAIVLANLGLLDVEARELDRGIGLLTEALALHRAAGDRRSEGIALGNLGLAHLFAGRSAESRAHVEAALAIHRELGNVHSAATALANLAELATDPGEARARLAEAIRLATASGDPRLEALLLRERAAQEERAGDAKAAARTRKRASRLG